ncbi:MAG: isoleucine--tRNA ligase, partial [Armatimonadetes bacterium]|nr:isoleucine--tRNA ligase [Armatimonadota bacterium]
MDYRATVNLPQTEFPQRASLAQREPERLQRWQQLDLYRRSLARREGAPRFELHDGPPYSNGHIHIGHVLNKVLKDIVVRYRDLAGHACQFIPGWDNHGLPIEYAVTKELGERGEQPDILTIRHACREYAQKWIDLQREEFERLGVRGDWAHPYLTMSHEFEAGILATFANLAKQGYVYRGERIVQWAPSLRTALADAEIEYAEKVSPSVYVAFPVTSPGEALAGLGEAAVVIWTTTPWTIPANMAIAVHPEFEYRLFRHEGRVYLTADYLANGLLEKLGWQGAETVKLLPGSALEGVVTRHPLYQRPSPLVFADYVTLEEGTGCVHTAPGHGKEDFETGRRHGLPAYCPVDEDGRFTAEVGERLAGRKVLKANDEVCAMLAEAGALLHRENYRHQYPHDWRAHEPIIFRATTQWFLDIDHAVAGSTHRRRSVEAAEQVSWYPREGLDRIRPMVENRPDWCLSRQRAWGVGIPVFYCGCGATIMTAESLDSVVEVVRREGSDAWFELPPEQLLPDGFGCPQCGAGASGFHKETDVLDVWFDSGSTHQVVYGREARPVDLYLEGSDQHRGWFNSSLMVSVGVDGQAPYKAVVTHGFVLDSEGKAMSKSLGNVVRPAEVIEESGADVLRLWVASVDFYQDVRLGDEILKRVVDAYRNIRNSFRFLLGNLHDFDPCADQVAWDALSGLDRYVLYRLEKLKEQAREAYEGYEFHKFVHGVHNFVLEVSAVYLDVAKDELYCGHPEGPARRAIQSVMYTVCRELATILAPVLAFTCDEVWEHLPGTSESVHLADWPAAYPGRLDESLAADFERLLAVRAKVKLAQEALNQGKAKAERVNPLEMRVVITPGREDEAALRRYAAELRALLVVSAVELQAATAEETEVSVARAEGHRCARSWRVFGPSEFGNEPGHPEVSDRDAAVVEWLRQ